MTQDAREATMPKQEKPYRLWRSKRCFAREPQCNMRCSRERGHRGEHCHDSGDPAIAWPNRAEKGRKHGN